MRNITSLVLMNLGLIGCKAAEPTQPTLAPAVSASANPTSSLVAPSSAPVASGASPASATATASATAAPRPSAALPAPSASVPTRDQSRIGKTCRSDDECGGYHCALGFNGANFSKTGTCQAQVPIYEGRPLLAAGEAHVASLQGQGSIHPNLVRMRDAALEEHASITAFARTICELSALAAPTWLLAATARALADEVRHAEDTFAWVERLGGGTWRPGPLPAAVAPLRSGDDAPAELYRDVFRGGAVGETLAAARADRDSIQGESAELRAFHAQIAEDEARHAALAFRTLQWLRARFPELGRVRDEEVAAFLESADFESRSLVEPLLAVL